MPDSATFNLKEVLLNHCFSATLTNTCKAGSHLEGGTFHPEDQGLAYDPFSLGRRHSHLR